jgi:protein tyrosine phosphatase (PTP) superfamily phosphohydrolase (DUF442 family)
MNAILTAREPLHGYTLYVRPLPPCPHCAGAIIQAGIKKIVWSGPEVPERWAEDMAEAMKMFAEAGVEVERVEVARVTASPQAVDGLVEALAERDAEVVRLETKVSRLESELTAAKRHDCRKMSATCVGGGAGQLIVYGDHESVSAVREIITAVNNLAKRVSELQKRRDELQEHNSQLHERIVSLRDQIETPRRRVVSSLSLAEEFARLRPPGMKP